MQQASEISDSYGDEYEDDCLPGCCAVSSGSRGPDDGGNKHL
jgi:hypothetical protein